MAKKTKTPVKLPDTFSVADVFGEDRDVEDVRKMSDLIDKEIIITGYKVLKGEHGPYQFVYGIDITTGDDFGFTNGSGVVMERLQMVRDADKLPVRCTIKYVKDKYYNII